MLRLCCLLKNETKLLSVALYKPYLGSKSKIKDLDSTTPTNKPNNHTIFRTGIRSTNPYRDCLIILIID